MPAERTDEVGVWAADVPRAALPSPPRELEGGCPWHELQPHGVPGLGAQGVSKGQGWPHSASLRVPSALQIKEGTHGAPRVVMNLRALNCVLGSFCWIKVFAHHNALISDLSACRNE